jgi:competence protein ComEC
VTAITWAAAFIAGVALVLWAGEPGMAAPVALLGTGAVAICAGAALAWRGAGTRLRVTVAVAGVLWACGAAAGLAELSRAASHVPAGTPAAGEEVSLEGLLLEDPAPARTGSRLRLSVYSVTDASGQRAALFEADVYATRLTAAEGRAPDAFRYGDRYLVSGEYRPYEARAGRLTGRVDAYRVSLEGEPGGWRLRRTLAEFRESLGRSLRKAVPGDAGALSVAMVTGDRRGIPERLAIAYREAGTAHILAISGMHITLVGGLAMGATALAFGRHRRVFLLAPVATVWAYAAVAGLSPSVMRAALMFNVFVLAYASGRQKSALPALAVAAAVMVAVSPGTLSSVSFQLSFAAMAGIAVVATRINSLVPARSALPAWAATLIQAAAAGLGATAATAPLFLFHFGSFAVWGAVATLALLPALPLLVISAAAAAILGPMSEAAARAAGWPAWLAACYTNEATRTFAQLPPGAIETGRWAAWGTAALYVGGLLVLSRARVAGACVLALRVADKQRAQQGAPRPVPGWLVLLTLAVGGVAWAGAATARPDGLLKVTFLETDRGDAIFIETPAGMQALIDGGRSAGGVAAQVDELLPFWDRSLDLVVLTHGDQDHAGGLATVLGRFDVATLADAPGDPDTALYRSWLELAGRHPNRVILYGGESLLLGRETALHVLAAGPSGRAIDDNDASVVMRLEYGDVSVLLTGDISSNAEARLLAGGLIGRATVLKVPHHGSRNSSSERFVEAVSPAVAVIQSGPGDPFGHPHEDALARLRSVTPEGQVYLTRDRGAVTVVTDGRRVWVETRR